MNTPRSQNTLRQSAEAMLSGPPGRAEFKRALKTADNPPHQQPHLMEPAGISRNPLLPYPLHETRCADLFSMQQKGCAEHLCTSRVYERKIQYKVPKPALETKINYHKLSITIYSATGLRNCDDIKVRGSGLSDPFCTVEIPGKPHSKAKTFIVNDSLNPVWNFQCDVQDFADGDALIFHVWDSDNDKENGDLLGTVTLQCSQFYPMGFDGEVRLEHTGDGVQSYLQISIPDSAKKMDDLVMYGGIVPEDDFTERCVRQFIMSARRIGSRGLPRITDVFKVVAANDGTLDEAGFTKVALAQGLCRDYTASALCFRHFKMAGNGVVTVDVLSDAARGTLRGRRLEVVRDVWKQLDPQQKGFVEVGDLMAAFDPRRLPAVKFDGVSLETARREYLEGLGVSCRTILSRDETFALEEAEARRRPVPVGHPGGAPVVAPAGKPGDRSLFPRNRGDVMQELRVRAPVAHESSRVSAKQFEDYYIALSMGISDDAIFERTLRDPWDALQAHRDSMEPRCDIYAKKKKTFMMPQFRVSATFKDGSRRMVKFSNVEGFSDAIGHGGVTCNQIWTWGQNKPEFQSELIRRLEEEGIRDVVHARVLPS